MTNISSSLRAKPFLLKPTGKDYLWGGSRLNDDFSKGIDMNPLAETWECSTHPDGQSRAAGGDFDGEFLADILRKHPEFLGTHPDASDGLPILIKFIDAKNDLSVQVHPDDVYASAHENGQRGKTEMWYVLHAAKNAKLVYGFSHDMDPDTLRNSLQQGNVEKYLQKIPVHTDDVFFIEPGTVHAIGAGVLIAEIQESSNLTYRMYDYGRTDKCGNARKLHIDKAMDVVNLKGSLEPRQQIRVLKYVPGSASEFLCRCKYFEVERMLINTERCRDLVSFSTDKTSFQVLLCIGGCGVLTDEEGGALSFFGGDCIFVPADSQSLKLHGKAQFLRVKC